MSIFAADTLQEVTTKGNDLSDQRKDIDVDYTPNGTITHKNAQVTGE